MDLALLLLIEATLSPALGCESIGFNFDTTDSAALFERCENTQETGHEPIQVALRTKQITVNSSEVVQTYLDKRCHTFSATVLSLGLVFFV